MKKIFDPQSAIGYRCMVWMFRVVDLFMTPDKRLDDFGLKKGDVVVDFGCGPGRQIRKASALVGPQGRVYAADINAIAIDIVKQKKAQYGLNNVEPVLLPQQGEQIPSHCADVVYALDMFHHVSDPVGFLEQVYALTAKDGLFFLEDGHQSRSKSLGKVQQSNLWEIDSEFPAYLKLRPVS